MSRCSFDRIIPGDTVGKHKFPANGAINGGARTPSSLGLNRMLVNGVKVVPDDTFDDSFFGGKCPKLGLNKETGFYICRAKEDPTMVLGVYIPAEEHVTDRGRELLMEHFGNLVSKAAEPDPAPKPEPEVVVSVPDAPVEAKRGGRRTAVYEPVTTAYADPTSVKTGRFTGK